MTSLSPRIARIGRALLLARILRYIGQETEPPEV